MTILTQAQMQEKVLGIPHEDGVIFSVTFIKRTTGELRRMNCRRGVKKYLAGGELGYNAKAKALLPVFDLQKGEYRMISCESIQELVFRGETYRVLGARVE